MSDLYFRPPGSLTNDKARPVKRLKKMADGTYAEVVVTEATQYATNIDKTSTAGYVYICEAAPGTLSSAAAWRISRVDLATGSTKWAGGSAEFDKIADNRTSLAYS